jgi:flagellar biosynthetic protein FliR
LNFDVNALFLPILQIVMVSLRVGSLWMFFPVLGNSLIPPMVRLAGALTLSMALRPLALAHLPHWDLQHLPGLAELVLFVLKEFIIGAGMGLVARWIFTVASSAAQWVGTQMGFSMGGIFNPEMQEGESAWAELHQWIATMVFLGIGGHWLLIQAVADSYSVDLSGALARLGDPHAAGAFWVEIGQRFFVWMLKLSGPMVVVLLLLQVALGVLSRFVPQINVWMVSIPLTIAVGVFVFTLLSPMYGDALSSLFAAGNESTYLWIRFLGVR